ncbi:MAG: OmpA family protein [Paramuribaculum sp.]|nr:OmpA family protein [Paramuribaculum sp.]
MMNACRYLVRTLSAYATIILMAGCGPSAVDVADSQWRRGEYFAASRNYRKVYNKLKKPSQRHFKGEIAFRMAECHRSLGETAKAAVAYQNALRYGSTDSVAQLRLASMLHAQGKYKDASEAYRLVLEAAPDNAEAITGLKGALKGQKAKSFDTRYHVGNIRILNSRRSSFSPYYSDGKLYFSSTDDRASGATKSEVTGMKRGDIYMSSQNEAGVWESPGPVKGDLNTEHDEGVISLTADGSLMYLTRSVRHADADSRVEIYTSSRLDGRWSAPVLFEIVPGDSLHIFAHPSVSPDGEWLYFCSDMPGVGAKDIWRLNLARRGAVPVNLGAAINTAGNEMFPCAVSDSILYFSSDGHPGFGGLDLFQATLMPTGEWNVENMGRPLNSSADDFGITFITQQPPTGFFSSNRGDVRGYDHIYSFELPDLRILISGVVVDKDEEPVSNAVIRIVGDDGMNRKTIARNDGSFSFPLNRGVRYAMLAGAKGYLNARQEFTSDESEEDAEYTVNFSLASLTKPNIVENIFYDFDKATLRPESKGALDGLVAMLRENPNITIAMASHTDRVGSDSYNEQLSLRRAKAVVEYLIDSGIEPDRLEARGYGKSHPKRVTPRIAREFPQFEEGTVLSDEFVSGLSDDDKTVADQINRRTEFEITSLDYGLY